MRDPKSFWRPPVLVIHASVLVDPAKTDAAVAAAKEMMVESRKEPGCHAYTFTRDLSEPGRFHIIEEWESDEALAVHFKAPHMAKFQQAVAGLGVKDMKAEKFVVSSKGPLRP
jgi:quinol monooxygenase YgiN